MRARAQAWLVPAALIALFALRSADSAGQHSVTVDEFAHLPAGLVHLRLGSFAFDDLNPPLARVLQALGALSSDPALPSAAEVAALERSPWALGYAFQELNRERYLDLFSGARWLSAALAALLPACVFAWSRSLFGARGGLASLALVVFEPNLVAHAGLVTSDVPFALAALLALWSAARLLERGHVVDVALAGTALGLALLTKYTALLLCPVLLAVTLLIARPLGPALARLAAAAAISLALLNAGYLFSGTLAPLAQQHLTSPALRAALVPVGRVPLPSDYLRGIDLKLAQTQGSFPTYLNGRLYATGAPAYYDLEAWLLKTPLAELAAILLAAPLLAGVTRSRGASRVRIAAVLWGAASAALLAAASLVDLNLGLRYLLLLYPLGALAVGALAARAPRVLLALLVLHALESVAAYPDEIAFFNAAVGGDERGADFLADSNLDWGQDLPALARLATEHETGPIQLAYFGRVDPRIYGVDYELPQGPPRPGWYAISANFLVGIPYLLYDARSGEERTAQPREFSAFRELAPVAVAGASIYLYRVE